MAAVVAALMRCGGAEPHRRSVRGAIERVASTDQLAVDGTFAVVVCLLVLAIASGQLIFLDSAGSSAGNESAFRNRDALAAAVAAGVTAVAAAVILAAAARFY